MNEVRLLSTSRETPDADKDRGDRHLSALAWLESAGIAFVHNSYEESLNGLGQVVNHVVESGVVPEIQVVPATEEAPLGTDRWYAQTLGGGAGSVISFLAVDLLTHRIGGTRVGLETMHLGISRVVHKTAAKPNTDIKN